MFSTRGRAQSRARGFSRERLAEMATPSPRPPSPAHGDDLADEADDGLLVVQAVRIAGDVALLVAGGVVLVNHPFEICSASRRKEI